MAKIRITEAQYNAIEESENIIEDFKTTVEGAIKVLNAQFGRLAFATMADVLDGDIDLEVIDRKMDEYKKVYQTKRERLEYFLTNHIPEDEYYEKWEGIHTELGDMGDTMDNKLVAIKALVGQLQIIADIDVEKHFSDIETRKI